MPIHRIPRATYDEAVLELERRFGEIVESSTLDGDVFVVTTKCVEIETRVAS